MVSTLVRSDLEWIQFDRLAFVVLGDDIVKVELLTGFDITQELDHRLIECTIVRYILYVT